MERRKFVKLGGGALTLSMLSGVPAPAPGAAGHGADPEGKLPPGINEADRKQRREKARRLMKENGVDALFITGSSDLIYFTGVRWWRSERTFGMILPAKGEPAWICPAFELDRAEERIPGKPHVLTWQEEENPFQLIAKALGDLGIRGGKLALAPTIRFFVVDGLRKSSPQLELVDGAVVTEACRSIKSKKEINCMDHANRLTKQAYRTAFSKLQTGMSPEALARDISQAHKNLGVSGGGWPSFGPQFRLSTRIFTKKESG